ERLVGRERVDVVPVDIEKLLVRDLVRVVDHLHRLGVTCCSGLDLLVARIRGLAARIGGSHADDTNYPVARLLHGPEAAAGKQGHLLESGWLRVRGSSGRQQWRHAGRGSAYGKDRQDPYSGDSGPTKY